MYKLVNFTEALPSSVKLHLFQIYVTRPRLIYAAFRSFSKSGRSCASHYEVLEVTPKATQHDIKSAYYRLSKIYHPDKSGGEESAKKFRAITEAYEVLGNISLKKMYDKGLLVGQENTSRMDYRPDPEPTDPSLRFYRSRQNRHIIPTMDGRTPIYNFDAWSKHHYGDLLKKNQSTKEFLRKKKVTEQEVLQSNRQEILLYTMFALGGLFIFCIINGTTDYDKVQYNKSKDLEDIEINK